MSDCIIDNVVAEYVVKKLKDNKKFQETYNLSVSTAKTILQFDKLIQEKKNEVNNESNRN